MAHHKELSASSVNQALCEQAIKRYELARSAESGTTAQDAVRCDQALTTPSPEMTPGFAPSHGDEQGLSIDSSKESLDGGRAAKVLKVEKHQDVSSRINLSSNSLAMVSSSVPAPTTTAPKSPELEKKRRASRVSSRRTREREKLRLDHFRNLKVQLSIENGTRKKENKLLRQLITQIKEVQHLRSPSDDSQGGGDATSLTLGNQAGGVPSPSFNAVPGGAATTSTPQQHSVAPMLSQPSNFLLHPTVPALGGAVTAPATPAAEELHPALLSQQQHEGNLLALLGHAGALPAATPTADARTRLLLANAAALMYSNRMPGGFVLPGQHHQSIDTPLREGTAATGAASTAPTPSFLTPLARTLPATSFLRPALALPATALPAGVLQQVGLLGTGGGGGLALLNGAQPAFNTNYLAAIPNTSSSAAPAVSISEGSAGGRNTSNSSSFESLPTEATTTTAIPFGAKPQR